MTLQFGATDVLPHAASHIPGGTDVIDLSKIVGSGASLPGTFTLWPAGSLFLKTSDNTLYRSTGAAWVQVSGGAGATATAIQTLTAKAIDATADPSDGQVLQYATATGKWGPATGALADGSVTTAKLADLAVTTAKMAANSVTSAKIVDGTVTGTDIAAATVTDANMVAGTLTHGSIAAGTIRGGGNEISATSITAADIAAATITDAKMVANTLTNASIAAGTIRTNEILDGTILNADISASAAIAYSKLSLAGSIVSADITDGTIVNADINASAAIAYSKLSLGTSIINADVSASAAIAYSKLSLGTSIQDSDVITTGFLNGVTIGKAQQANLYGTGATFAVVGEPFLSMGILKTTGAVTSGRIYAMRWVAPITGTVGGIWLFVNTVGTTNVIGGMYDTGQANATHSTRTLLTSLGQVANTATGYLSFGNPAQAVTAGYAYDIVVICNDSTMVVNNINWNQTSNNFLKMPDNGSLGVQSPGALGGENGAAWTFAPGSFALPATIAAGSVAFNTSNFTPIFFVKVS